MKTNDNDEREDVHLDADAINIIATRDDTPAGWVVMGPPRRDSHGRNVQAFDAILYPTKDAAVRVAHSMDRTVAVVALYRPARKCTCTATQHTPENCDDCGCPRCWDTWQ